MFTRRCNSRSILTAIGTLVLALTAAASAHSEARTQEEPIEAIWHLQRFDFEYHSHHTYYACEALQAKIGSILKAVGAHEGVAVELRCLGGGFVRSARARVTLSAPVVATAENVAAVTTYDTRAELVARLRKVQLPTATDIERFPATWRTVSLSRHRKLRLDAGDCELLKGVRDQIFPRLGIRVIKESLHCIPGSATRIIPKLEVAALMAIPALPVTYLSR